MVVEVLISQYDFCLIFKTESFPIHKASVNRRQVGICIFYIYMKQFMEVIITYCLQSNQFM